MTPECSFRRVVPADAQRLLELNETALRGVDAYAEDAPDEDLRNPVANYVDIGGEFLVGTVDGEVVAMGAISPIDGNEFFVDAVVDPEERDRAAEVTRMRVDPDYQGRGFGTRLLEALEDRARGLGFEVLVLDTTARQSAARRLYESFDYEVVEDLEWREYEVLCYRKDLDGPG